MNFTVTSAPSTAMFDDQEFIFAIKEASELINKEQHSGYDLTCLFASLLFTNTMNNPYHVWNNTWTLLAKGIEQEYPRNHKKPGMIQTFLYFYLLLSEINLIYCHLLQNP